MKKEIIPAVVIVLLIFGSVGVTYYKIMIAKNYIIEVNVDCDPAENNCFVWECDASSAECSGVPEKDNTYFKVLQRKAFNVPDCDPANETCGALECDDNEKDCGFVYCSETNKAKYYAECSK